MKRASSKGADTIQHLLEQQAILQQSIIQLSQEIKSLDISKAYTISTLPSSKAFTTGDINREDHPTDRYGNKIILGKKALLLTKGKSRANKGIIIKVSTTRTTVKDKKGQRYWREHSNIQVLD